MTRLPGERRLARRTVFVGRIFSVHVDEVERPDGVHATRELVDHPGAVAILPLRDARTAVLLRQWRHAVDGELVEIPAGRLEPGEAPEAAARRELREETGYEAASLRPIARVYASPGFCNERIHIYVAEGLTAGASAPEADEQLTTLLVDREQARAWLAAGRLEDAKTMLALLWWLAQEDGVR